MQRTPLALALAALTVSTALTGCSSPTSRAPDAALGRDSGAAVIDASRGDANRDAFTSGTPSFVYGSTRSALYRLDVDSGTVSLVGDYDCISLSTDVADSGDGMTDIAIDGNGRMLGVGRGAPGADGHVLVTVDETRGSCTQIGPVLRDGQPSRVQGLSFVPVGTLDPSAEVLIGTDGSGAYFRIDPRTGAATTVGIIMTGTDTRGGDLVSVHDGSTWMITSDNALVTFDLATGAGLSERAVTGLPAGESIGWGMGFWAGRVYAFSFMGRLYAVDPVSGAAVEIPIQDAPPDLSFRGAAVTTFAPLI